MRQFAALAGISNPYLSQIERGLRDPSEKVMESIAEALQTSADALYHQAGMDDEPEAASSVVDAITADPRLTAAQRRAMLTTYAAFLAANGEPPRRKRRRPPTAPE